MFRDLILTDCAHQDEISNSFVFVQYKNGHMVSWAYNLHCTCTVSGIFVCSLLVLTMISDCMWSMKENWAIYQHSLLPFCCIYLLHIEGLSSK